MIQITKVTDLGQDTLEVRGFDDSNASVELVATGWVSAMTNYFDETNGERIYREMTEGEKQDYWVSLLQPHVQEVVVTQPQVLYEDPAAITSLEEAQTTELVAA